MPTLRVTLHVRVVIDDTFLLKPVGRSASDESNHPTELLEQMLAGDVEEGDNDNRLVGAAAPLVLLNGHVCALSPETPRNGRQGVASGFKLRDPYVWESDEQATGFLMPRWMWSVVGGEVVRPNESGGSRTVPHEQVVDRDLHEPTILLNKDHTGPSLD